MERKKYGAWLSGLLVDAGPPLPLYRRVYLHLRELILAGKLARGTRLPSSRTLAKDLDVSRNTILTAIDQLASEGYVESRRGDGTYVSASIAEDSSARPARARPRALVSSSLRALSERGRNLAATTQTSDPSSARAFAVGVPAVDAFPMAAWQRSLARRSRLATRADLVYGDAAGYGPLREAVASYLGAARGVRGDAEQVLITTSSQQALDVALRVLVDPGDVVCMEEPGYLGARGAFVAAGVRARAVSVDENGLRVEELDSRARLAYVTPSHQYPLGGTLSLARRLSLLEWAESGSRWILEDDYDSEFRYAGRPLSALQGLDDSGRVIYIGTFTKVLFPSLRLAYVVAPPDLIGPMVASRRFIDGHSNTLHQAALADFIESGQFGSHIRRMRELYRRRQRALLEAVETELGERLEVQPDPAGMHLVGLLPEGVDDRDVVRRAAALGVEANPLSRYYAGPPQRSGLVMGYACVDEASIHGGVRVLARAIEEAQSSRRIITAESGQAPRNSSEAPRRSSASSRPTAAKPKRGK